MGLGVFVGPEELGVAVQPQGDSVKVFLREFHAVVTFVEVSKQLRRPRAELAWNHAAAPVDARRIETVDERLEPEAVLFGQVIV